MMIVWAFLKGMISKIFRFFVDHPIVLLVLVCAAASGYLGYTYKAKADKKVLNKLVSQYEEEAEKRQKRIEELEKMSKDEALANRNALGALSTDLENTRTAYQERLNAEKKSLKIVRVEVPGPTKTVVKEVTVDSAGDVVCGKMPQAYVDTVNLMVKEANARLNGIPND